MSDKSKSKAAARTIEPFGMKDKIGYGLGDFGCNMSFAFINNYMLMFFVTCMHINPAHYAAIIVISKILDAINDIIVGRMCDRSKVGKRGKFVPWIQYGSIPLLITSVLLFIYIPDANYYFKIAECFIFYFLWGLSYTCVNVPYGSLQSVMTKDSDQRATLSTFRSVGAMLAQIPVMILVPLLVYDDSKNPVGGRFIWIMLVMGVIAFVAFTLLSRLVTERVTLSPGYINQTAQQKTSIISTLKAFFRNRPMIGLSLATIAQISCINTLTSYMQYIFMLWFKNTDLVSVAVIICSCPMVLGIILSKPLLRRMTKRQVCSYPFLIAVVATAIITFIPISNAYVWMVFAGIAMMGQSCFMVLVWAMVSDCIDYQEERTGAREEGSIYAIYSFFRKAAQGLGQGITSLALVWAGYNENLSVAEQAATVPERIRFTTGFIPLVGCILCFVFLFFIYNLGDKKTAGIAEAESAAEAADAVFSDIAAGENTGFIPSEPENEPGEKDETNDNDGD